MDFSTQGDLAFKEDLETALNSGVPALFKGEVVPPPTNKKVAVIGAGIAGLVAAKELLRIGTFNVQIYERTERVGGRTYTLRGFSDELYGEGGAMRIPNSHYLTHGIIDALSSSSKTSSASSSSQSREEKQEKSAEPRVRLLEFYQKAGAFVIEGKKFINKKGGEAELIADIANTFNIDKTITDHVVNEYYFTLALKEAEEKPNPMDAWQHIFDTMDGYSVRTYFTHKLKNDNFGEEQIAQFLWLYNVINTTESLLETDVIELFKEFAGGWWEPEKLKQIKGGIDVLATEYAKEYDLNKYVKFGVHVVEISKKNSKYSIVYHNQAEQQRADADFDDVIITVPFTALRLIDIDDLSLSLNTKQAIRTLQYLSSTKVLLQFRERFWTNLEAQGMKFGTSTAWGSIKTDLPVRNIYAPNPDMYNGATKRGVLLASYTWGLDGIELASMKDVDLIQQCLKNVKQVFTTLGYEAYAHGDIDELFEQGRVQRWGQTEWTAGGAFCFVAPGQYNSYYDSIVSPQDNNKVILAGEHASNSHGWIQGAIESGLRAAIQIYQEEYQVPSAERKTFTFGKQMYKKITPYLKKFAKPKPTAEITAP